MASDISAAPRSADFFMKLTVSPILARGSCAAQKLCIIGGDAQQKDNQQSSTDGGESPKDNAQPARQKQDPCRAHGDSRGGRLLSRSVTFVHPELLKVVDTMAG
jgi:hypothetical protein